MKKLPLPVLLALLFLSAPRFAWAESIGLNGVPSAGAPVTSQASTTVNQEAIGKPQPPLHPVKGNFTFLDGRTCDACTAYMSPDKLLVKLVDANGYEWEHIPQGPFNYDAHPHLHRFREKLKAAGYQYQQQQNHRDLIKALRPTYHIPPTPIRQPVNCTSTGYGNSVNTSCY